MIHLITGIGSIGSRYKRILEEMGEEVRCSDLNLVADWRGIDIVWICTPTSIHHEDIFYALNQSIYIFCEKPLTDDFRGAIDIEQVCSKKEGRIYVSCNMRFHPCVQILKKAFDEGKAGEVLYIRYNYSFFLPYQRSNWFNSYVMKDGILLDCIHEIDLALWFGGEMDNLQGFCSQLELPIHDLSRMYITHKNKIFSEISLDFLRRDKVRQVEIIGKEGTLYWRSMGKDPEDGSVYLNKNGKSEILYQGIIDPDEMYKNQIKFVMENKPHNLQEHMKVLKVALDAREQNITQTHR